MEAEANLDAQRLQAQTELEAQKMAIKKLERELQEERRESEEERNRLAQEHERFVSFMCEFKDRTTVAVSLAAIKKLERELHEERRRAVADVLLDTARLAVDLHTRFRLGVGATGSTYRGTYRFPALAQPSEVAVKVFLGGHAIDRAAQQQIVTEMRLSTKAEHPNLIRIFGIAELQEHGPVLVMELAHGGSLRAMLSDRENYPDISFRLRIQWLSGIAKGMAKLHGLLPHGVVHRDLKSANVLLSSADLCHAVAKVADFGLARAADTIRSQQSSEGGMVGTLAWKAPETFNTSTKDSEKSDVFSYAVTAFEVVTRGVPWEGFQMHQIVAKVKDAFDPEKASVKKRLEKGAAVEDLLAEWLEDNPLQERRPDLSLAEAGCPEALRALICRCWADDPEERPTFTELGSWRPPTTLAISNFKRAYDEAGRIPITLATQVFGSLVTFVHTYCQVHGLNSDAEKVAASAFVEKLQREIADHHGRRDGAVAAVAAVVGEVGATAELLWTSAETFKGMGEHQKEFCSLLNDAIRNDDARLMPCTAALVRAINALCVAGRKGEAQADFPPNGRTFRGTAFSNEHRQFFVPGTKYRAPGFVATSFEEGTALGFAVRHGLDLGKPAVLWEVHVDPAGEHDRARRCKHVNYVKGLVGREQEYLFTAYSVFTVRRVEWSDDDKTLSRIVLEAAHDNSTEDEDLPLAPWY